MFSALSVPGLSGMNYVCHVKKLAKFLAPPSDACGTASTAMPQQNHDKFNSMWIYPHVYRYNSVGCM